MSLETHYASFRPTTTLYGFQQQQTAANEGKWDDIRIVKDGTFEFCNDGNSEGTISVFSAQIMISNALTIPDNSIDGTVVDTVTSLTAFTLPSLGRWMKVKVTELSASGGATLGARLQARNY